MLVAELDAVDRIAELVGVEILPLRDAAYARRHEPVAARRVSG